MRHLRNLFRSGTAVGFDDDQLLNRYAQARDESAFEALVARHGPMVLATCRAVLKNGHDVEDAFQATFLVLARKARSVRAGNALGGWLHRVAYRAAIQASVESRQRRLREAEAAMARSETLQSETEIPSIVHEELDRLPDRYRLPVILCDVEGLTYEQAAQQLRWTEPTLRHRLAKARQRLRDRLIRRGVSAGITPAGLLTGPRPVVPVALARLTVAGAAGGASSTTALALTNILIRSMLMTKLKFASVGILVAITLASGGMVAVGSLPADEPIPRHQAKAEPKTKAKAGAELPIEGRIVDLEGRPVVGAKVELYDLFSAPDNNLDQWLDRAKDRGIGMNMYEGLQRVNIGSQPTPRSPSQGPPPPPIYPSTTTDGDGKLKLARIGPAQIARVRVTGPTIVTDHVYVMGREGSEIRVKMHLGMRPNETVFHPRRFEIVAPACKPIEGVVRAKETGKPVAGINLTAAVYEENNFNPAYGIEAKTDDRGFYRLLGLPRAPAYRVFVEPSAGKPYPSASYRAAAETPAFDPVIFDIAPKRGVVVRGKVTDKVTGKPLKKGYVQVFAFADNPHIDEFPGFRQSKSDLIFLDREGRYQLIALPGRSLVGVRVNEAVPRYRLSIGAEAIRGYKSKEFNAFRTYPSSGLIANYHALAEINLDSKAESATLDLQVDPGNTIKVNAVDSDGKPVVGTTASGTFDLFSSSTRPQASSEIEIFALAPSHPRRVIVTHAERKLIGSVYLKGDETGSMTLRLQPSGTIVGRVVDEDGKPRARILVGSIHGSSPKNPAEEGILPGGDWNGGVPLGKDGRFRFEGLVPGLKYSGVAREGFANHLGDIFRDVIVGPGEVMDLGDLKAIPPKRPN